MQSMLNIHGNFGLPLCVSGISPHHLTFSKEMADHDRRREAMKRQRSEARANLHGDHEMGFERNIERMVEEIKIDDEDLAGARDDICFSFLACTAKAA